MAEFFAVLNAISALASSLSLVAATIRTVRDLPPTQFTVLYNCFKDQESALRVSCLRLRGWERLWTLGSEETREDGGDQQSRVLDGRTVPELRRLQRQVNEINAMLEEEIEPPATVQNAWKVFDSPDEQAVRKNEVSPLSFRESIESFDTEKLINRVGDLVAVVEELRLAVAVNYVELATTREEETASQELSKLQSLSKQLVQAYQLISGGEQQVGLIMRPPDDMDIQLSINQGKCRISTLWVRGEEQGTKAKCVACQFGSRTLTGTLSDKVPILRERSKPRGATLYSNKTIRGAFQQLIALPAKEREQRLRETYLLRITSALYITVMAVILLSTDVMKELTTECITEIRQDLGDSVPAFIRPSEEQQLQSVPQEAQDRRFFMLAVLLAELALAQPIHIGADNDGLSIKLQNRDGREEIVRKEQLLLRVKKATSLTYQRAVSHCFFEDGELLRINTASDSKKQKVLNSAQSVARFHRYIFLPLAEHYRIVRSYAVERVDMKADFRSSGSVPKALQLPGVKPPSRTPSIRSTQSLRTDTAKMSGTSKVAPVRDEVKHPLWRTV